MLVKSEEAGDGSSANRIDDSGRLDGDRIGCRQRVSIDSGREAIPTRGFEITGTVGSLSDVEANDGGEATITASVSAIKLKAANAGRINGADLEARTVEAEADNGARITICATGNVAGTVANGAELIVMCGGNPSGVETSNGGTVTTP